MRLLPVVLSVAVCAVTCTAAHADPLDADAMSAANAATEHYIACSHVAGLHYMAAMQRDMGVSRAESLESVRAARVAQGYAKDAALVSRSILGAVNVEQNRRASAAHIAAEYMRTCVWNAD
jgi:hypothetical protein